MGSRAVFSELYGKMCTPLGLGEDDEPDPKVRCTYCTRKVRVVDCDDLQPGDHISMGGEHCKFNVKDSQWTFDKHHSIVTRIKKVNKASCMATLVHFHPLSFADDIQIRKTTELLDLREHDIYKVRYCNRTHSPEKIIKRAELSINSGRRRYSRPVTCNCEQFCHWCSIGSSDSFQGNVMFVFLRQIGPGAWTNGGKICRIAAKIIAKTCLKTSLTGGSGICVPWGILSVFAIGYLIFCIYHHHFLNKDKKTGVICSRCCSRQVMALWSKFFFYCITQAGGIGLLALITSFVASTGIAGGCIAVVTALSTALMVGIPKLRAKLTSPFRGQMTKIESIERISIGDAISFKYKLVMHDGIVSNIEQMTVTQGANISLIHYSQPCVFGRRVIKEETLDVNLPGDIIKLHDYSGYTCHPPEIVVQRARQRIGEKKFDVFSNRSCHFCHWAKVNEDVEDAPPECQETAPMLRFDKSINMGDDISKMVKINVDHRINRKHSTKTMDSTLARIPQEVKEGSVVQFKYGHLRSWHFAVTTEVKYPEEPSSLLTVTVVHYGKGNRPCEEKFHFDLRHDDVWIHKYHPLSRYSRKDVIKRARERVGQGNDNKKKHKVIQSTEGIARKDQDEIVTNFNMVKPGDVIIFYYWRLKHAAIVVKIGESSSKANNRANVTVIHYALDTPFSKRIIKQETMLMDLSRDHVYRRNYGELTYTPSRVIRRAKSRLGEKRFNANGNTSWDLVHWTKVVQTPALVYKSFDSESSRTTDTEEKIVVLPHVSNTYGRYFQRVPVHAWRDLQPGIIIEYSYYWIWHQAILVDVDYTASQITVIHYGTNTIFSTRTIMKDTFQIDLNRTQMWMYRCDLNRCNPPEVIVTTAYERLGEQKWGRDHTTWDFCKACVLKKRPKMDETSV